MDFVSFFNAVKPAYEIEQSLRFDGSSYLSRTFNSSESSTFSVWVKRGDLAGTNNIFGARQTSGSTYRQLFFEGASPYGLGGDNTGTQYAYTNNSLRDPSAWYHIVYSTGSNNTRIWINGVEASYRLDANGTGGSITNSPTAYLGAGYNNANKFNGYMAEFHFIDGQQLDPDNFGKYDDNGVWVAESYTGTYGTNGFYLKFDSTATNGIGHDHSGNGNNWTASGFTTSGTGTDVLSDTPTKNWCTMNPLFDSGAALSNGNLYGYLTSDGVTGTIGPTSGKWYFETTVESLTTNAYIGIADDTLFKGDSSFTYSQTYLYLATGVKGGNGSTTSYGATYGAGDVIGVAFDLDAPSIRFYKNGIDQGEAFTSLNNSGSAYRPFAWTQTGGHTYNFGQREFANRPGDTVGATSYFNTVLYTGNGSTQSITGVGFQPDLVIAKNRDSVNGWRVYDSVRGVGIQLQLDSQNQEETVSSGLTSFDSDGFSLGSSGGINGNGINFAAWCWKAGGTASSNTDGSITSSVSANNDAGFSVVTYSGTNTDGTVGHGLNAAPDVIIFKRRNNTTSWPVYTSMLGASKNIYINETGGEQSSGQQFGSTPTAPTNSVFSVGNAGDTNYGTMLAYCFTEKTGVSKFGTYEGKGRSEGPAI